MLQNTNCGTLPASSAMVKLTRMFVYSLRKPFSPPEVTLKEIHSAVPKQLLRRSPALASYYIGRDLLLATSFAMFATYIPTIAHKVSTTLLASWTRLPVKALLWCAYWWFQGLVGAGIFCLGHDVSFAPILEIDYSDTLVGRTWIPV